MDEETKADRPPKSLVTLINETCARAKGLTAYKYKDEKDNNKVVSVTYDEYFSKIVLLI